MKSTPSQILSLTFVTCIGSVFDILLKMGENIISVSGPARYSGSLMYGKPRQYRHAVFGSHVVLIWELGVPGFHIKPVSVSLSAGALADRCEEYSGRPYKRAMIIHF